MVGNIADDHAFSPYMPTLLVYKSISHMHPFKQLFFRLQCNFVNLPFYMREVTSTHN